MSSPPLIFGRVIFGQATRQWPPEVSLVPLHRKRLVVLVIWVLLVLFSLIHDMLWASQILVYAVNIQILVLLYPR
jgi:uncharacterized membrane protein YbaN (DUF454 family)